MDKILDDPSLVQGVVYLMVNTTTGKKYVGQTLSHRKNRDRYRPFGAEGRFRDHISEATNNTKRKQCTYLNNAIRLYGPDAFIVSVLESCDRLLLDSRESHYISEMNTLFPNGYNLTTGGKPGGRKIDTISHVSIDTPLSSPKLRGGCKSRSAATRQKMSERAAERGFTDEERLARMVCAQLMHSTKREERFKHVQIDPLKIDEYVCIRKGRVTVNVDGITANFIGKYESEEALREKAKEFLKSLIPATLPNCSGNP
jgi:group I intron endonuclease